MKGSLKFAIYILIHLFEIIDCFSGKAYKMFDDQYMEFDNATEHCTGLAAR